MSEASGESGSLSELDDDQLVALALDGRLDAFNVLVRRYQTHVLAICRSRVGMADAEDVMQEAFIKAWQRLDSYRQGQRFRAWLGTIARNTCNDLLRQRQRRPTSSLDRLTDELGDSFAPPSEERSPEAHALNAELGDVLRRALATLPEEQRIAVTYREVNGMDYREIADATGWSMGTVKSRISRGKASLRIYLESGS